MRIVKHGCVLPEWSLCYIVNGDDQGLSDKEIAMVDSWLEELKVINIDVKDEGYFAHSNDISNEGGTVYDCVAFCYYIGRYVGGSI